MSHVERVSPRVVVVTVPPLAMDGVIEAYVNRGYTVVSMLPYKYQTAKMFDVEHQTLESVLVTLLKDASSHGAQLLRASYLDDAESKVETPNPTPANPAVSGSSGIAEASGKCDLKLGERAEPYDLP